MKKPLHNHLLLNGYAKRPFLEENETIEWLRSLVEEIGMKIVQGPFSSYVDEPGNRGITSSVMIETSHIAMHIWDEDDPAFVQFDLYTCSTLPVQGVLDKIIKDMEIVEYDVMILERSSGFKIIEQGDWNALV